MAIIIMIIDYRRRSRAVLVPLVHSQLCYLCGVVEAVVVGITSGARSKESNDLCSALALGARHRVPNGQRS